MKQKFLSIKEKKQLLELLENSLDENDINSMFKKGDILYIRAFYENIIIFKEARHGKIYRYANLISGSLMLKPAKVCDLRNIEEIRKATQNEISQLLLELEKNDLEWDFELKQLIRK